MPDPFSPGEPTDQDRSALKSTITSAGFWQKDPTAQRSTLRQSVPYFRNAPDQLVDSFLSSAPPQVRQYKAPDTVPPPQSFGSKAWDVANTPAAKLISGDSITHRILGDEKDYVSGSAGKGVEGMAKEQLAKGAGTTVDPMASGALYTQMTPGGRAVAHRATSEFGNLVEGFTSPIGAITAAGGKALKAGEEAYGMAESAMPWVERGLSVGKKVENLAHGAFTGQALSGGVESIHEFSKDPTPENAVSVLFRAGLAGGMVASTGARMKSDYAGGSEAVRTVKRAQVLSRQQGGAALSDLPAEAQRALLEQSQKDVRAGVKGTEPTTRLGKIKANREVAARTNADKQSELNASNASAGSLLFASQDHVAAAKGLDDRELVATTQRLHADVGEIDRLSQKNDIARADIPKKQEALGTLQSAIDKLEATGQFDKAKKLQKDYDADKSTLEKQKALVEQNKARIAELHKGANPDILGIYRREQTARHEAANSTPAPPSAPTEKGLQLAPDFTRDPSQSKGPAPNPTEPGTPPPPVPSNALVPSSMYEVPPQGQVARSADPGYNPNFTRPGTPPTAAPQLAGEVATPDFVHGEAARQPNDYTPPPPTPTAIGETPPNFIHGDQVPPMPPKKVTGANPKQPRLETGPPPSFTFRNGVQGAAHEMLTAPPPEAPKPVAAKKAAPPPLATPPHEAAAAALAGDPIPNPAAAETEASPEVAAKPEAAAAPPANSNIWEPGTDVPKGRIVQVDPANIKADPARFQYKADSFGKGGTSDKLRNVKKYDPEQGGAILAWQDPANGQAYVVNGHHRLELAQRTGHPEMDVRFIDAPDAATARAKGALRNIGENQGTSADAAKVFRDMKITPEDLHERYGISPDGHIAKEGFSLSKLDPFIFKQVVNGDLQPSRGAVVGDKLPHDAASQQAALDYIQGKEKKGTRYTNAEFANIIDSVKRNADAAGTPEDSKDSGFGNLFGEDEIDKHNFGERAEVSEGIVKRLRSDKELFRLVSKGKNAKALEGAGNKLNADTNAKISDESGQFVEVFRKLENSVGPIDDILNECARSVAKGMKVHDAIESAIPQIRSAFTKLFGGANAAKSR